MATPPVAPLRLSTQLTRFVLVGGVAFIVAFSTYHALLVLGLGAHLADGLAFIAGTATAYLINRRWTFQGKGGRAEFASVMALYGITFAVQLGIHAVVLALLPSSHGEYTWAEYTCAFVVAQGVATAINFAVQRAVIFRS
ncbi:MAG TPA: GtrA family protein [Pseudonocardiaceae bacterium]|nr:GtrA family protein [Pseudonocardiaceae bacterium]